MITQTLEKVKAELQLVYNGKSCITNAHRRRKGKAMTKRRFLSILCFLSGSLLHSGLIDTHYARARANMVKAIENEVRETSSQLGKARLDPSVIAAMKKVPRHTFVPLGYRLLAYKNRPLPIGFGQTISQPYVVAVMTDLLALKPTDRVLEVGTGSGYQAAVLAGIVKEVYTIEVIGELAASANKRLKEEGYTNVRTRTGDGYYGWEEKAPFDAIIVTAAAGHIPPPLLSQLKPGGRMVIPVKGFYYVQHLLLVTKTAEGKVTTRQILPVAFVPLTGEH
jgi:protein-L-isoaspartate(D-aspartate) O-methyltransferase